MKKTFGAVVLFAWLSAAGQASALPSPSQMTSPAPESRLTASTVLFEWTAGQAISERYLSVGRSQRGVDIYGAYQGGALSRLVGSIPPDAGRIFVSLYSWDGAAWLVSDYTYEAPDLLPRLPGKSVLTAPIPGYYDLPGDTVTFQWTGGSLVAERYLALGSTPGGSDIFAGFQGVALAATVPGIPRDCRQVYATLWSWIAGAWEASSATYRAFCSGVTDMPSIPMMRPLPGQTLAYPSATFYWIAPGEPPSDQYLMVGTSPGGSEIYAGYQGLASSRTVDAMPRGGMRIYVRLMGYSQGTWRMVDYDYVAAP